MFLIVLILCEFSTEVARCMVWEGSWNLSCQICRST